MVFPTLYVGVVILLSWELEVLEVSEISLTIATFYDSVVVTNC